MRYYKQISDDTVRCEACSLGKPDASPVTLPRKAFQMKQHEKSDMHQKAVKALEKGDMTQKQSAFCCTYTCPCFRKLAAMWSSLQTALTL